MEMDNNTEILEQTNTTESTAPTVEATTEAVEPVGVIPTAAFVPELIVQEPVAPEKPKNKRNLFFIIGAVALVVVVALVLLLLPKGPNVNEMLAGNLYECSSDISESGSWFCVTLAFDETGENFTNNKYTYSTGSDPKLRNWVDEVSCEPEKVEDGVYSSGDYTFYLNDEGIEKIVWDLDGVEYEFYSIEESEVDKLLRKTAVGIFADKRVYPEWSSYTFNDIVTRFFQDYEVNCEAVSNTQYRVTLSGSYYPVYGMQSYVKDGEMVVLVDLESEDVKLEKGTDVFSAMQYYVIQMM